MKITLKDNYIYLDANTIILDEKPIQVNVTCLDDINIDDYTWIADINGSRSVFNCNFNIDKKVLKYACLTFSITRRHNSNLDDEVTYTLDSLPITRAVLLGANLDELYPQKIKEMCKKIEILGEALVDHLEEGEIL